MLSFPVFDPKVGEWIKDAEGNTVEEKLKDTILETLFPNEKFSFALVDDATNAEDLQDNHPNGHKLLFSSGSRFVFGTEEMRSAMDSIFPESPDQNLHGIKDRGAYGALLIGDCNNENQQLDVCVIDRTGANDRGADPARMIQYAEETAAQIANGKLYLGTDEVIIFQDDLENFAVGSHLISPGDFSKNIGAEIEKPASFIQKPLRILIVDDESGENGGVLPNDVARELTGDCHGRMSPDLSATYGLEINKESGATDKMIQFRSVLPDFDNNPDGLGTHKIAKGTLLGQDLSKLPWQLAEGERPPDLIIAKSSFKGATKPPVGLHEKDIWLGAKSVSANGKMSVSSLIPLYPGLLKDVQPRLEPKMAALAVAQNDPMSLAKLYIKSSDDRKNFHEVSENGGDNNEDVSPVDSRPDSPELKFIRAAVTSNNPAALQTPLAVKELKKFVKNEWKSLALGQDKSVAFERSMALPDKKLANGEICVPWLPDGEELIVYRPPVINTNGIHILTNKLDTSIPYGEKSEYIAISDQNPVGQSIMGDMALDFDGDHVAFARATDYPALAREVKLKQEPGNRYPDVVKEKKQEFAGVSQEEAALQMARSPVGLIANSLIAIQSEISAVEILQNPNNSWINQEDLVRFASESKQTISKALTALTPEFPSLARRPNNLSEEGNKAFNASSDKITDLAKKIASGGSSNPQQILKDYKSLLREVVGIASGQNQIAVDMPKSARAADEKATMDGTKFLAHKSKLQQEKKLTNLYLDKTLTADGISPQEILAATTNQYFRENGILQSPPSQFKELFADTAYTAVQKAQANTYQEKFQKAWTEASGRLKKEKNEVGVSIQLQTSDGKSLEVTNLHKGESPIRYLPEQIGQITIEPKKMSQGKKDYHTFQVMDSRGKKIGDLCELSAQALDLPKTVTSWDVEKAQLKSRQELSGMYFGKAREIAVEFSGGISADDRKSYAAAMWAEATKESSKASQEQTIPKAVLYAFPDELADQVLNANMNRVYFKAVVSIEESNEAQSFKAVTSIDNGKLQTTLLNDSSEVVGYVSQMGYPMRPGSLQGKLSPGGVAMLQIEIPGIDQPLSIGKVNDFSLAGKPIDTITEAEITIEPVKIDSYRLAINGKPVSDPLSDEAVNFAKEMGLDAGNAFTASVVSRDIASPDSQKESVRSSLYLNFGDSTIQCVTTDKSLPRYEGEQVELSIVNSPKYTAGVFLKSDDQSQQIGEFTASLQSAGGEALSPKNSLDLLVKSNALEGKINGRGTVDRSQPLKGSLSATATIKTDGTNQILEITSQDLTPPNWQLEAQPQRSSDTPLSERLRAYNSQKPPVMLQQDNGRSILAVDSSVGSATSQWAEKNGAVLINGDFRRETNRGFAVIEMETASISPALQQKMVEQGMATITSRPDVYNRLIRQIPSPQEIFSGNVAGVNIASNSVDPLGQKIALLLKENYEKDRPLAEVARMTFDRNPELARTIKVNGGESWLEKCEHKGNAELSGKGSSSPLVKALSVVYRDTQKVSTQDKEQNPPLSKVADDKIQSQFLEKGKKSKVMSR
jgi:hypothetical protein